MKMIKKTTVVLASIAAVVAMTACSSDSSSGSGGGSSTLATGGFHKSVNETGSTSNYYPFSTVTYQKIQHLYTAAQIQGSGNIEKLTFTRFQDEPDDITCTEMTIRIGHSSLTGLTTTYASNVEEGKGSMQVIEDNATVIIPAGLAGETFDIPLSTPFAYNGVDSLVLEYEHTAGCSANLELTVDAVTYPNSRLWFDSVSATGNLDATLQKTTFSFAGGDNAQVFQNGATTDGTVLADTYRVQVINLAEDINGSGPITGLAYQVGSATTASEHNLTIRLGHTSLDSFTVGGTFADNYTGSSAIVAESAVLKIPDGLNVGDWFWIPLSGSFNYNGTDNLIVDVQGLTTATAPIVVQMFTPPADRLTYSMDGTQASPDGVFAGHHNIKLRFNGASTDVITDGVNSTTWLFRDAAQNPTRQALYRASELGTAGKISKVACRMAALTSTETTYSNYVITMGHTTNDQLSSTFADNFDDATVVYDGNYTVPAGLVQGDWIEIPVSPFTYDGERNLAIQFAHDGSAVIHQCMMSTTDATRYPAQSLGTTDRTALTATLVNDQKLDMRLWIQP